MHAPENHPAHGPILLLTGPTAVGKSAVAIALAGHLNGEIISADSMQVYRGLDIGTAKPSAAERKLVPHHLIDVVSLTQNFDAAQFVVLANGACTDIRSRQRLPILCGGTGLYFKAFLEGLGQGPPANPALRKVLEQTPLPQLLLELETHDPVLFGQIDRENPRRIVRALEVMRLTGRPFSELRSQWKRPEDPERPLRSTTQFYGLKRAPEDWRRRIDARVELMFEKGLVDETQRLLSCGLELNRTAMQAIGYRQVVEHLHGVRSLDETVELIKQRTRQYAKRQMTWFRRQAAIEWIDIGCNESSESIATRIVSQFSESPK